MKEVFRSRDRVRLDPLRCFAEGEISLEPSAAVPGTNALKPRPVDHRGICDDVVFGVDVALVVAGRVPQDARESVPNVLDALPGYLASDLIGKLVSCGLRTSVEDRTSELH